MATWQQNGNPGGLLGGIGMNNTNAPQASDVDRTMAYIRDNNDRERAGQNNIGLQAVKGFGDVRMGLQQAEMAQQKKDYQSRLGEAVGNNDKDAAQKLLVQYPQFLEDTQKQMGFIDAEQNKQTASAAMNLRLASQSNDPQAVINAAQGAEPVLQRLGLTPQEVYQSWQQNPQGFNQMTDLIHLHADPNSYFGVRDKQQAQGVAQQNANTNAYNAVQGVRQGDERLDLDQYKAQSDNQLRTREMVLKARLGKETNDVEREKINNEITKVQQAKTEKQTDKINTVAGNLDSLNQALGVGRELSSIVGAHPTAVSRNQGGVLGVLPNLSDDTKTLAAKSNEYNLKVVLPALRGTFGGNPTEGERTALMQAQTGLKNATSNADFMRELNKSQNTITRMQKRQISDLGIPVTKSKDETTDVQMLMQDPSLVKEYVTAHGYLPEGYYQAQLNGDM